MKLYRLFVLLFFTILICYSCIDNSPNTNSKGVDIMEPYLAYTDESIQHYHDTVYVPVYSDIYTVHRAKSLQLTATLSIRSTSLRDTTYINEISYYNTHGELVRSYIDKTLILAPMQSIDYVIDRDDTEGGSGANFLITWGGKINTHPLFQAVMIGTSGQHGLSFVTDGVSLKNN